MKRILTAAAALTVLAGGAALAQPYGNAYGHPGNRGYDQRYDQRHWQPISQRIDRLQDRIDRGFDNGALTRGEARRLSNRLDQLVMLERHYLRNDGRLDYRERADLEQRLEQLRMEIRFERRDADQQRRRY